MSINDEFIERDIDVFVESGLKIELPKGAYYIYSKDKVNKLVELRTLASKKDQYPYDIIMSEQSELLPFFEAMLWDMDIEQRIIFINKARNKSDDEHSKNISPFTSLTSTYFNIIYSITKKRTFIAHVIDEKNRIIKKIIIGSIYDHINEDELVEFAIQIINTLRFEYDLTSKEHGKELLNSEEGLESGSGKYSFEQASSMNSIEDLEKAKLAIHKNDNREADIYINKVLSSSPSNWEALMYKGIIIGRRTPIDTFIIASIIDLWIKSYQNCPDSKLNEISKTIQSNIEDILAKNALIAGNNFVKLETEANFAAVIAQVLYIPHSLIKIDLPLDLRSIEENTVDIVKKIVKNAFDSVVADYEKDSNEASRYDTLCNGGIACVNVMKTIAEEFLETPEGKILASREAEEMLDWLKKKILKGIDGYDGILKRIEERYRLNLDSYEREQVDEIREKAYRLEPIFEVLKAYISETIDKWECDVKSLIQEQEKIIRLKYWDDHPEEYKKNLEDKKRQHEEKRREKEARIQEKKRKQEKARIEKEKRRQEVLEKIVELEKEKLELLSDLSKLGLFALRQKKEINLKLSKLNFDIESLQSMYES